MRNGFSDSWWYQAIGLVVLLGLSVLLSWIFLRGSSREKVWITKGELRIRRSWLKFRREDVVKIPDIIAFEWSASDVTFDMRVRITGGLRIPVVRSHSVKKLEHWSNVLSEVAPVECVSVHGANAEH